MTKDELEYWGPKPYPCTLEDWRGFPKKIIHPNGTLTDIGSSNIGSVFDGDRGQHMEVVWDGAKPGKHDHTKGRLLSDDDIRYVDTLVVLSRGSL